jgi:MFS family permease
MATDIRAYGMSPFGRFALANAFSTIGDTVLTVALATSIFFSSLNPKAAQGKVILFLLITMAPFAVVAPILGPALDRTRGGRRALMIAGYFVRAVLLSIMVFYHDGIALYPLALGCLVVSKGHSIAKSSLLPAIVGDPEQFVHAGAQLAIITALASIVGAVPAALFNLLGTGFALAFGVIVYVIGGVLAFNIPKAKVEPQPIDALELQELAEPSVLFAVTGQAVIRCGVGFVTFFCAFSLKNHKSSLALYGVLLAASAVGGLLGNWLAPIIRRKVSSRFMLVVSILAPAVVALFAARFGGFGWLTITALVVAIVASTGQLAYESIVQSEAPDASRGRNFARFETRFQILWVLGALIPVLLARHLSDQLGLFILAVGMGGGGLFYLGTLFRTPHRKAPRAKRTRNERPPPTRAVRPIGSGDTGASADLEHFRRSPPDPRPDDSFPGGA